MLCHSPAKNAMKLSTVKYLNRNAIAEIPTDHKTNVISPLLISPIFFDILKTCNPISRFHGRRNGTVPHHASSRICSKHPTNQNPAHAHTSL